LKSIRFYLIIVLLSTICLVNFLAALQGYRRSMDEADQLLDEQLRDAARLLSRLAAEGTRLPGDMYTESMLFQIWYANNLVYHSVNARDDALSVLAPGFHMQSYRGLRWRLLVMEEPHQEYRVIVGQRADVYAHVVESIIIQSLLPIIWVLPGLGLVIWLIVGFGLAPLKRLARLLSQRRAEDLTPLDANGYPGELAVVVASTNQLLGRLSDAFARERRFAADAAHELRTPLAALKVHLDNLAEEFGDGNGSIDDLRASVERMSNSIEQILMLNRLSPEVLHQRMTAVELEGLARSTIVELYDHIEAKGQHIELQSEPVVVEGDEFALMTLLRNLVDNAGKYTPDGGRILVTVGPVGDCAVIRVEDSGPGIPADQYHRVFDRFYRVGGDRHASRVIGCGLGLSIVDHIVRLHRGEVELDHSAVLGGLAVQVQLPRQLEPMVRKPAQKKLAPKSAAAKQSSGATP